MLLDQIANPSDLRLLDRKQLQQLVDELRSELVQTIATCGGHFASSLGVVELTVALHSVFDTPDDRIVFDTGHQGYIHKMLTGRRFGMSSIRQFGGLSGFLHRKESRYDAFGAGHAGTSISAALGMLEGLPTKNKAVAVIGDGSMTAGMAFEALNHAGAIHKNLIVVLNDNEMSIAPNVGALSLGFAKAVTGKYSTIARRHFKGLVEKGLIPHSFYRAIDKAEEATQGFLSTPGMLFTAFGFRYLGPVDGHDLGALLDALERAKNQDGPVLLHAITTKGKGYSPAEDDPVKYHGVTPFDPDNGSFIPVPKSPRKTYTNVFGETVSEICSLLPNVVAITAAMPDGTGLQKFSKEHPAQYYDVGIAEQHAVTFAAGLACEDKTPIVAIYSTFLQRAYDQVLHDVCLQNLPVIFALDRAGLVGADGATHHGVFDLAYLRSIPNIVVAAPRDESELKNLMWCAVESKVPFAIRYPRGEALGSNVSRRPIKIGTGEILQLSSHRPGAPLLIGLGNTVEFCRQAAEVLEQDYGLACSVVDARFVKPLDTALIAELAPQHNLIITVEDHVITGGLGSAVLECLSDQGISSTVVRLGVPDSFIEHGTQKELYRICEFDTQAIVSTVLGRLGLNNQFEPQRTATAV